MECLLRWFIIVATASSFLVSAQYGGCSKERTDYLPGVTREMYKSISDTECELVKNTQFQQYDPSNGEIFDYIIVGAGAAGSLLANRLSANPNVRILLLEAGGDPTITTEVPALAFSNLRTDQDWKYPTAVEDGIYWGAKPNGTVILSLGKAVGGSTSLNIMFYTRGYPADYDLWSKAGNIGWSYKDLLPHFKQLENMKAEEVLSCESCMKYHGTEGELWIETFTKGQLDPYSQIIVDGFNTLGFGLYSDYNNPDMAKKGGYYFIQGTKKNGRRCNAGKAFLKPVENRRNLRLSKHSLVTKVLINENKEAYGVELKNRFNETIRVLASKETILSAGSVKTPQVMMLSGVGPQKQLQDLGIQVKHPLSVGANYQDHPLFYLIISLDTQFKLTDKTLHDQLFEYITRSTGIMSTVGSLTQSNAIFINSGNSSTGYPDVEIIPSLFQKNDPSSVAGMFSRYTQDIVQQAVTINKNKTIIIFNTVLLKPNSRGSVTLQSSDPQEPPTILSGYFKNKEDFYPIISAIRIIEKLVASKPMRDVGAKLELLDFPRCRRYRAGSDDYWTCAIRHLVTTTFHPCCTMRMGPASDNRAVVDSRLRVRGISKLRAVDLSVSPSLVSAHTQATAYVIAHKAADMIMADYLINDKS